MAKILGRNIYLTLIASAIGLAGGVAFTLTLGDPAPPPPNQLTQPPATPYQQTVSGTGLVEANSRNVNVGVFVSGIVDDLAVNEGDKVEQGDVLLAIDTRSAEAEVQLRRKDVASAEASVKAAEATLADEEDQLARVMSLAPGQAISVDQQQRQQFAAKRASAALDQAKANFDASKAALAAAKIMLEKHTVRAPLSGEIFKVLVRAGEFVDAARGDAPIVMGSVDPLHLRVQIDENDLWRFTPEATAVAFLRSNSDRKYSLTFVRVEPLVQPKQQLSGATSELVDTRIMEVIYAITPIEGAPLYIGQQLDVFVDAKE